MHVCISYNTGKSALLDIRTTPKGEHAHIRQSTSAHVITNIFHPWHSQICQNLKSTVRLSYIV